jgi:hypothetical protein
MTMGAEVGEVVAVVAGLDAADAGTDAGEEGTDSGILTGPEEGDDGAPTVLTPVPRDTGGVGGVEARGGSGLPVTGDPTTDPDESNVTVTGTTTTAVVDDELDGGTFGSDTTTDSCLEVS